MLHILVNSKSPYSKCLGHEHHQDSGSTGAGCFDLTFYYALARWVRRDLDTVSK